MDSIWERRIHIPFVVGALVVALTTGFGYAALLVGAVALNIPTGLWWLAWAQAHGHAQLFGWVGMFILGMGLYFLPRLRGARLQNPQRADSGFWLLLLGILGRALAQPVLGTLDQSSLMALAWRILWLATTVAQVAGLWRLVTVLRETLAAATPLAQGSPAWPVLPFVGISLSSLAFAFLADLAGTLSAALQNQVLVPSAWNSLTIDLMLYGVGLPMTFVFAIRNLPLFLRLAMPPREPWRRLAGFYGVGLILRLTPDLGGILGLDAAWLPYLGAGGAIAADLVVLGFLWVLDLARRRPPWTTQRMVGTRPDLEALRPATRRDYPDAGEYGRFELLVYAAFAWLAIAVIMNLIGTTAPLFSLGSPIPGDAERHTLALGYLTLLILGMAVRMVPGFSGKKGVPHPGWVLPLFWLGNLAVLLRVVPLFFGHAGIWLVLFGFSGAVGWLAIALLAANLAPLLRE